MSDPDRQALITEFKEITGVADDRAKFYLESTNWTLQIALASFFEHDEVPSDDVIEDGASSPPPHGGGSSATSKGAKEKKSKRKSASNSRIMTLNNMASSSDEDDDNAGQAFYAGGSDRSGQQILGPPKKNTAADYVSEIFRSAKESGAEVSENRDSSSGHSSRSFGGGGYRLGQTNDDHIRLPASGRSARAQNIEPVILRLWRTGFTINDGDLRLYEDQQNKEFLECVTKGELPPELRNRQRDGHMVEVNLEDHRHEEYKPVAPKVKPFGGKGHTLGSPTPSVTNSVATSTVPSTTSAASNEENEILAAAQLNIDDSAAVTTIQIRLADGSRLAGRFNHSHTIDDIRRFINTARPQYANQTFALLTTFPSKELSDANETIDSAKLLNSALLQRLK